MSTDSQFVYVTCQVGAEGAVKGEIARQWPAFRFAYSRPGFLTFKIPPEQSLAGDADLGLVFGRAFAFSIGKVTGASLDELARAAWALVDNLAPARLHVWQRDQRAPGDHGYEPGMTADALAAREALLRALPAGAELANASAVAQTGDLVLDCVLVNPDEWWIGYHRARSGPSCLAGGLVDIALLKPPANRVLTASLTVQDAAADEDAPSGVDASHGGARASGGKSVNTAVSRAYLKIEEALWWSRMPIRAGDQAVELGCSPGGSCQALLDRGLTVIGVDPAEVHTDVAEHPNFTHLRRRAADVRRREFRKTRWLMADMNVAPAFTLDAVESIVMHDDVHVDGLLLTLKLAEWHLADEIPAYLERIRAWGFSQVMARQLHHGRQEICVAALTPAALRRPRASRQRADRPRGARPIRRRD